jgi:hypothetical protein
MQSKNRFENNFHEQQKSVSIVIHEQIHASGFKQGMTKKSSFDFMGSPRR